MAKARPYNHYLCLQLIKSTTISPLLLLEKLLNFELCSSHANNNHFDDFFRLQEDPYHKNEFISKISDLQAGRKYTLNVSQYCM